MRYLWVVLSAIVLTVGLGKVVEFERSMHLQSIPIRLESNRDHLGSISRYLQTHKNSTGDYPSNDQGLMSVELLVNACNESDKDWSGPLHRATISESGILTVWGEPFIYENRRGLCVADFADSGATIDVERVYSVNVDEDVYVWSIGAKMDYEKQSQWRGLLVRIRSLILLSSLLLLLAFVFSVIRRSKYHRAGRMSIVGSFLVGAVIWLLIAMVVFPCFAKTGYDSRIALSRTPELTNEYLILMEKYHERHILGDRAYQDIVSAISQ